MRFFREKKFLGVFFAPAGGRKRVVQPLSERTPPEMDFKRLQETEGNKETEETKETKETKEMARTTTLIATSLMSL